MARATHDVGAPRADVGGDQRALHKGFGDALALGMELALVPVIFALFGLWLDGRFGTRPVLMLVLLALAVIGLGARSYYAYVAQMDRHDEGKPWARRR